jgi:hypothetical protein
MGGFISLPQEIMDRLFDLECDMIIAAEGEKKITKAALKRFAIRLQDIRNDIQI